MHTDGIRPELLYVAVPRAKTSDTVFLLENVSESDIVNYIQGPSEELRNDVDRLRRIERSGIKELYTAFSFDSKLFKAIDTIIAKTEWCKTSIVHAINTE